MNDARAGVPTVPGLTGLSVLARGGYATVYRAVQVSVGRDVAVKVENRRLENERDQRRFLREARAAGRMSGHPNVIDLFDAGMTVNGHPYLIMELCEASYAERMKTNPLSAVEARDVGVKIADALADAHALGVLHRDVKPANLLMSRFGEPQLADFGLAVLAEARDHSITLDVLTPAYAPPEMFRYAPPSPAADVYALCATLYALMRGRPARWRDDLNPSLVSLIDMFGEPILDVPGAPVALMALLRAGMANGEHDRPTAVELRDALLVLDLDPGSSATQLSRRPAFGPPSWGPSESISPASATMPGGSRGWGGAGSVGGPVSPDGAGSADGAGSPDGAGSAGQPLAGDQEVTHPHPPRIDPLRFEPGGFGGRFDPGGFDEPASRSPSGRPVPGRSSRRRWRQLAMAVASLALIALLGIAGLHTADRRAHAEDGVAGQATAPSSVASSPRPSDVAGGSCGLTAASPSMRCPATAECFADLAVTGGAVSAASMPCDRPHAWEVFALDTLPPGVVRTDYRTIKNDVYVRNACSGSTLALVDLQAFAWHVDVLPPSPDALRAGDRTFRCVAGPVTGRSTGSRFVRAGR